MMQMLESLCKDSAITLIRKFKDLVEREDDTHEHVGNFRRDEKYKKIFSDMLGIQYHR